MNSNSFEADFKLNICKSSSAKDMLTSPDLFRHLNDYLKWTSNMSNTDLPAWLGFGKQAEGLLTTRTNFSILSKWNILYSKSCSDVYEPLPHAPLTKALGEENNVSMELYRKGDKRVFPMVSPGDGDVTKGAIIDLGEEGASSSEEGELSESSTASRVTHLYSQNENVLFIIKILDSLPQCIPDLERNEENMSNAVFRCFERENHLFRDLLKVIRGNLNQLKSVLEEKLKYTNKLRALAKDLNSFNVPPSWLVDGNATNLNLTNWIRELINRFYQIIVITTELNEKRKANVNKQKSMSRDRGRSRSRSRSNDFTLEAYHQKNNDTITAHFKLDNKLSIHFIWLGGLFYPRAFITATRQLCASKFKNSLDDLELSVAIGPSPAELLDDTVHFTITCLSIEGAQWSDVEESLTLSDELAIDLPPVTITWEKKEVLNKKISEKSNSTFMELPIYLDKSRRSFIGFWKFPVSRGVLQENWYQRGVAIFLSKTY